MITGFTDSALIIYPPYTRRNYYDRDVDLRYKFELAVKKLKKYLNACKISLDVLTIDRLAQHTDYTFDRWVQTLGSGDTFYLGNNGEYMKSYPDAVRYPEILSAAQTKFPNKPGENRAEAINRRGRYAAKEIIKKYKLIVLFDDPYEVWKKKREGCMMIRVDTANLICEIYLGDMLMDRIDILGIPNANMPMYEWEV